MGSRLLFAILCLSIGAMLGGLGFSYLSADPVLRLPEDIIGCPDRTVRAGPVCIDRFEASVWSNADGTGTQYGASSDDYPCSDNGNDCGNIFAVSTSGVTPARYITWFQAQRACMNVGKRLPTNAEWQGAAFGTPDSTSCNISGGAIASTSFHFLCRSWVRANNMVGNVQEWVADWIQDNFDTDLGTTAPALYGSDLINAIDEANPTTHRFPAALARGGAFNFGSSAGVFALNAFSGPSHSSEFKGFRCAC